MRIVFLNVCVLSVHYQTYPSHDPQALGQLSLTNLNIEGNSAKLKHIKRNRHTTTNWERLKTLMALSLLYEWFTASLPDVGSSSEPCFSFMHQRFRRLRVNGPREHHCPRTLVESLIYHCNMNGTWEITQLARKSIVKWFRFDAVAPEDAKVLIDFGLTFGFFFFSRYQNSAFACVTTSLFYAHIIRLLPLIHCVCMCKTPLPLPSPSSVRAGFASFSSFLSSYPTRNFSILLPVHTHTHHQYQNLFALRHLLTRSGWPASCSSQQRQRTWIVRVSVWLCLYLVWFVCINERTNACVCPMAKNTKWTNWKAISNQMQTYSSEGAVESHNIAL